MYIYCQYLFFIIITLVFTFIRQLEETEQTKAIAEMAVNISNHGYLLSKEAREKQMNSRYYKFLLNSFIY